MTDETEKIDRDSASYDVARRNRGRAVFLSRLIFETKTERRAKAISRWEGKYNRRVESVPPAEELPAENPISFIRAAVPTAGSSARVSSAASIAAAPYCRV